MKFLVALVHKPRAGRGMLCAIFVASITLCWSTNVASQTTPRSLPPVSPPAPMAPPPTSAPPVSPSLESTRPPSDSLKPVSIEPPAPSSAQTRRRAPNTTICGNPNEACRTAINFQPYDLPFRVPASLVIHDTELFYAVILKSMPAPNDNCDIFIPESYRLEAQALFPDRKVFASRCAEPESLFYTNTKRDHRIMAVYAGKTLAEANRVFAAVKATGKFPGANVRRMRTGFNGT